jgi:hypothetical protein
MVQRLQHAFAAETVERPEQHQVEPVLAGVLEQPLELFPVTVLACFLPSLRIGISNARLRVNVTSLDSSATVTSSNLICAGVRQKVAMPISGHKTTSIFNRYNIVDERDLHDAADKLNKHLNGGQ